VYDFETQSPSTIARQLTRLIDVRVSSTVILLGLTSLFTDISSEMVSAVLPLYGEAHGRLLRSAHRVGRHGGHQHMDGAG